MRPSALLCGVLCVLAVTYATADLSICDLIVANGYQCEVHTTLTEDGFFLGINRIPPKTPNAPVVILQHGLLDCSATWLNNLPSESLGYILHDAGYDVWLGNSRGNSYSQDNVNYPKHTREYWELVDWGLMAQYDIPAFVGYVVNATGKPKIGYVGHSQGTTQMFAALSANYGGVSEYISVFVALAPVAYVKHQKSPVLTVMADAHAGWILDILGDNQFMPNSEILKKLGIACDLIPLGCDMLLFSVCGPSNPKNINTTRIDYYLNWEPADTSVRNMMHWAQSCRKEEFGLYDYGEEGNLKHYHQKTAPAFNLTKIAVPTALFSGGEDWLGDPMDVAQLRADLNPQYLIVDNYQQSYAHLDFVWSLNAHTIIYPTLLQTLQQYVQ